MAIDSFNQIIEHIPDETFSLNKIGSCYLYLEKYDLALSYFNKVLDIDSEDSDALLNMGLYYNDLEMYDDALIYLDKCIEIQPNDRAALLQMANIYKNKQDYHNALRYVNQALGQNPNDLMLQLTKNLLLSNIGEFEESINGFKSISLEGIDNYGLNKTYHIPFTNNVSWITFSWVETGLKSLFLYFLFHLLLVSLQPLQECMGYFLVFLRYIRQLCFDVFE